MYIHTYIYIHIHSYQYLMYVLVFLCNIYKYIFMHILVYTYIFILISGSMHLNTYLCYVCIHTFTSTTAGICDQYHIYKYTYIHMCQIMNTSVCFCVYIPLQIQQVACGINIIYLCIYMSTYIWW